MKRYTCIFTSVLQLISCALPASSAALPNLTSLVNPPILQAASATLTSTGLVPLGTRVPFQYQDVELVFVNFGKAIPLNDVLDTLEGAHRLAATYSDTVPQEGIPGNRFEYRLSQRNVLLAIGGPVGKDITWRQLYRVLEALIRFMIGLQPPLGPHYQELDFYFQIIDVGGMLGSGVVWYFPPDSGEMQKRTTTPVLAVSDGSLLAFNESSNLTLAQDSDDDDVFYPIQGTSMTLEFFYMGLGLPPAIVTANLEGALKEVSQYSTGPYKKWALKKNGYRLVTGGATFRVATTVRASNNHQISWLELYDVLYGLLQFVLGINETTTHYQTLGYRILENDQGKIGIGTLSYYDLGPPPEVERRVVADGESSLGSALPQIAKSTNQSFLSVIEDSTPFPISWSIPDTDLTLTFTGVGDDIPIIEILTLLGAAQIRIASNVHRTPRESIGSFRYEYGLGSLFISVVTYDGKTITWLELHDILVGLARFCAEEGYSRASQFVIDAAGQGRIGSGVIASGPFQTPIQRRASGRGDLSKSDSTFHSPGNATAIPRRYPSFPIPGTPITLDFESIGPAAISPIDISGTLTSALQIIEPHLMREGGQAIPGNQWMYRDRMTNVSFGVIGHPRRTVTWQQLSWITVGLLHWMTGPGLSDCKSLTFDINIAGQGIVAIGLAYQYHTSLTGIKGHDPASLLDIGLSGAGTIGERNLTSGNSLERRAAESPNPAEEGILPQSGLPSPWFSQVATQSISARPKDAILQIVNTSCIPGSPLTITITRLLQTAVPAFSLVDLVNGARQVVQAEVAQRPQDYLTNGYFYYEVPYPEGILAAIAVESVPGHTISWLQLDETLGGLEDSVVTRQTTETLYRQSLLFKRDIDMAEWSTVQGQLGHTTYLPQTLPARSLLSSTGTNLTMPIPYPIPNTNIRLRITLLSPAIPASRLADLFNNARRVLLPNVTEEPDEYYDKDVFFSETTYLDGREVVAIEVYPRVNEHLTWLQLYQTLCGLQLFLNGAMGRPYRRAVVFKVDIDAAYIAYGSLSYIFPRPTSTLKARSPPPSNAILTDPIPYPLVGTPITLAFTSLLPTPIPIERVIEFFNMAFASVKVEILDHGAHSSLQRMSWNYRQTFAPRVQMSFTILRMAGKYITWKNVAEIVDGVESFMEGKWRSTTSLQALAFNVEVVEQGVVAQGALTYDIGLSGLGEVAGISAISNLTSLS